MEVKQFHQLDYSSKGGESIKIQSEFSRLSELANEAWIASHLDLSRSFIKVGELHRLHYHIFDHRSQRDCWMMEVVQQIFHICWLDWVTIVNFFENPGK